MQQTPNQSERQYTWLPASSTRTYQTSLSPSSATPKTKKELLCKIAFEIDNEEQELLIYDNMTLDMVTDELIMKLNFASLVRNEPEIEISQEERIVLEQQIKTKIQIIIQSCIDNSLKTIRWKKKLTDFISDKTKKPQKDSPKLKNIGMANQTRSVSYFGYNTLKTDSDHSQSLSNLKSLQIIQRGKQIQHSLSKCAIKGQEGHEANNRLYELGRRNDAIKQYLSKIRQQYIQQEQLNQCTFHPNLGKLHLKTQQSTHSRFRGQQESVFDRLYKEAVEKQEKMKIIERQVQEKQQEQYRHFNFIPNINSCSRDIVSAKKQNRKNNTLSVYEQLYSEVFKKEKQEKNNTFMFRPTLCPKSELIAKKAKKNKSQRHLFLKEQLQREREKSSYQSEAQTKRSTSKRILRNNNKQPSSFLKNFEYLYKFENQSPRTAQTNTLKQIKKIRGLNQLKSNENDQSIEKRVQTVQSQTIKPSKVRQKNYKNVVDISAFGSQVQTEGNYFKETKENLFFLPGSTAQSHSEGNQYSINNILTERINGYNHKQNVQSKKVDHQLKTKKGMLNPFQFFQQEELKNGTRSNRVKNRVKTENTSVTEMIKQQPENNYPINREKIFEIIFEALSYKKGEQIGAQSIFHSKIIPGDLSNVFLPMAEEMKQLNVGLDKQQFVWSLSRIYDSLSQQQRQSMLIWSHNLKSSRCMQSCHNKADINN